MKGRFGQLLFAHFAKTLEARDIQSFRIDAFLLKFCKRSFEFLIVGAVNLFFATTAEFGYIDSK